MKWLYVIGLWILICQAQAAKPQLRLPIQLNHDIHIASTANQLDLDIELKAQRLLENLHLKVLPDPSWQPASGDMQYHVDYLGADETTHIRISVELTGARPRLLVLYGEAWIDGAKQFQYWPIALTHPDEISEAPQTAPAVSQKNSLSPTSPKPIIAPRTP